MARLPFALTTRQKEASRFHAMEESPPKKNELRVLIDATGLSVARHPGRWWTTPYGEGVHQKQWVKLHALVEAESKSILTYSLTDPHVHDTVEFPKLVYAVQAKITEIYADAGYLSAKNCWAGCGPRSIRGR